jgi:uncharacterized phage protein (TIGR01671 family)
MSEDKYRVWRTRGREQGFMDYEPSLCDSWTPGVLSGGDNSDVLMLSTGRNDKNGKEIYKSDIVRLGYRDGSFYEKPIEVKFGLHRVGFDSDVCLGATALGFYFSPYPYTEDDEREIPMGIGETFDWDNDHIEVIGNIYEHQHLL